MALPSPVIAAAAFATIFDELSANSARIVWMVGWKSTFRGLKFIIIPSIWGMTMNKEASKQVKERDREMCAPFEENLMPLFSALSFSCFSS